MAIQPFATQIQAPQIQTPNPINQMGQLMALRDSQQQNQMRTMQMQDLQQKQARGEQVRNLFAAGEPNLNALAAVDPDTAMAYGKYKQEQEKTSLELSDAERKAAHEITTEYRDQMARLNTTDPNVFMRDFGIITGMIHGNEVMSKVFANTRASTEGSMKEAYAAAQAGPEAMEALKARITTDAKTFQSNLEKPHERAARLETERHNRAIEGGNENATLSGSAVLNAAARYNLDGSLPPLGMGKGGAQMRTDVLNAAALLSEGVDPTDQRIRQITAKADSSALTDLTKRTAAISAFERNFTKNANMVLEMNSRRSTSAAPIIQRWINAGRKSIEGDPELAAFNTAIKAVTNEYGKIVSGSMGNTAVAISEVKRMEDLLNAAQTQEAVGSVIATMRRETDNRIAGLNEEKESLLTGLRKTPAAPALAPAPATAAPPATKPAGEKKTKSGVAYTVED